MIRMVHHIHSTLHLHETPSFLQETILYRVYPSEMFFGAIGISNGDIRDKRFQRGGARIEGMKEFEISFHCRVGKAVVRTQGVCILLIGL